MDEQHAFFVKNSPRIQRERVSEDSHLFPLPLLPFCFFATFIFGGRTNEDREQRLTTFARRKENAPLRTASVVYTREQVQRTNDRMKERKRERERGVDTYDITTSTWRIKRCTAYVMRDCGSACTTRDVLDSGLCVFLFFFLFPFIFFFFFT